MDQKPVKRTGREGIPLPAHPPEKNNSSAGFGIETHCRLGGRNPQKKITTIVCFARILRELKENARTITCNNNNNKKNKPLLWLLPCRGKGACVPQWTLRATPVGGNFWQVLPNWTGRGWGVRQNTVKQPLLREPYEELNKVHRYDKMYQLKIEMVGDSHPEKWPSSWNFK